MEPVEIDILLNSNVAEEGAKATSAIEEMAQASLVAREETKGALDRQREYLSKLRAEYQEVQKQLSKMEFPTKEKKKLQSASNALARELSGEEQALRQLEAEWTKMNKGYSDVQLRMRQTREQMKLLAAAGRENSTEYRQLAIELEELAKANALITRTQAEMAKGSQVWKGLGDAVSAFSGAASAAVGVWALLGGSQEEQAKIQTKLQSLMAITIGLQQVQNVLTETSTFRIQTVTKAKALWSSANVRLATTLGISNVAAKALMATLTLGLSVAIGAVISLYDKWSSKQKKVREEQVAFNNSVASKVDTTIAKYEALRQQFVALNGDSQKQEQFVRENAKAFEELGVKVSNAHDAENILVNNTEAFTKSIMLRAKAAASMELASEQYKLGIQKMLEAESRATNPTFWDRAGAWWSNLGMAQAGRGWGKATGESFAKDASDAIEKDGKNFFDAGDKLIAKKLEFDEEWKAIWEDLNIVPNNTTENAFNAQSNALQKASERLAKLSSDLAREATEIELAAMREGRAKKLREIEEEYKAKKALIEKRQKELDELEAQGINVSSVRGQLNKLEEGVDDKHDKDILVVNTTYDRVLTELDQEVRERTASALNRRLSDLDKYYEDVLAKAAEATKDEAQLEDVKTRILEQKSKERTLILRESELQRLDSEERIALRQAQMSTKRWALQSEREENLLKVQLEYSQKRLKKLEEIEAAGGDAGEAIDEARQEIEELTKELEEIPAKKILEIGAGLKNIFSQLSGIAGEVGGMFGELSKGVDNIMVAFNQSASTMDRISGAVGGLMQLYNIAAETAEQNQQAMEAWNQANESALQVARMQRIESLGYKEGNLWGVENPYARAIAGAKQYAQSMKELNNLAKVLGHGSVQVGTKKVVSGKNVAGGAAGGAAAGAAIGSIIPGLGTAIGAGIGAFLGGIFGATKKKVVPVFDTLAKKYGQIFDKNTFELNPKILQDYDKLTDSTKKLVDNWEQVKTKAKEAQKEMEENFRSITGDIGKQLSDALVKGFQDDNLYTAMDEFDRKVSEMIYNIMQQMVFAQYFQKYFDELEERMKRSFDAGGDGTIVDDIIWFSKVYRQSVGAYSEEMKKAQEELKKQGFENPFDAVGRKAVAKGIARADQDSIDDLNGRMTVVVDRLNLLISYRKGVEAFERETRLFQSSLMRQVDRIAENTDFLRELSSIKSDIFRLRQEGVRIKR